MSTQLRAGDVVGRRNRVRLRYPNVFAFLLSLLILASSHAQAGPEPESPPLDLNRATAEELVALPGIGESKAAAILAVRDAKGGFRSVDELESVRGIGPAIAARLRPLVVVEAKAPKALKPVGSRSKSGTAQKP